MSVLYLIILVTFIISVIFLIHSFFVKYNEQYILTRVSENITDGYLMFSLNGKITNFNKTFLELFNVTRQNLKNKIVFNIFNEIDIDEKYKNQIIKFCKKITTSNESIKFEVKIKDKILKLEIRKIVNNDIFLRYVMICKDVTHSYKIIDELKENQDMMANREKFATLGQLISRNCIFLENTNFFSFWGSRVFK